MIVATVNEIVNDVVTSPNNIVNAFVDLFSDQLVIPVADMPANGVQVFESVVVV